MIQELTFSIHTEDGLQKLTLSEYKTREDLMAKIGMASIEPRGRRVLFLGTTILSYSHEYLKKHPKVLEVFEELEKQRSENPLKYFVPANDAVLDFLNDSKHNLKMYVGAKGSSKTTSAWIDVLLDIINCEPGWPIFKVHGVKWRPCIGPLTTGGVGIISYEWANQIQTITPQVIMRWTPREALGEYGQVGGRPINWKSNPHMEIAGTPIWFHACSQAVTVFEGTARDIYWFDETPEENVFNACNTRVRRRDGRHIFSLTPYKIPGRPDTGAGSFVSKLIAGEMDAGMKVKTYHSNIFNLPPWVYSEEAKRSAKWEWEDEPAKNNNIVKLREGRAVLYGEVHQSSGLVFDIWTPKYHVIDDFEIPKEWTRYRYIDHGRIEPTAAICVAVNPKGERFIYDEYRERDRTAHQNAKAIIEWCGNTREVVSTDEAGVNRYREVFSKQRFVRTLMDPRSMPKKSDDGLLSIGEIYKREGMYVKPADTQSPAIQAVIAAELLRIDFERKHYATGEYGAPNTYVLRRCKEFIKEIQTYVNEEVPRIDNQGRMYRGERPDQTGHHLMPAFCWMACDNPRYIPGASEPEKASGGAQDETPRRRFDSVTGY